jgi:hypothetical protein
LNEPVLGKEILVPVLDGGKVLEVLHHVQTRSHVVWALQKREKVLGLEHDIGVESTS